MELIPDWAPNIHPLIVHFPIAILLVAALMELLDFFMPDRWWDEQKTTILYGIGTLSAIVAYYTGRWAADSVFLPSGAQSVLNEHAGWAGWTVWFFGIYVGLRLLLHWYQKMKQMGIRVALLLMALPGLFMLYETGDHGAKMVFGYGVETGTLVKQEDSTPTALDSLQKTRSTLAVGEEGNWSWPVGPKGVSTLISRFTWLKGSASEMDPKVVSNGDNYLLQLTGNSTTQFFVHDRPVKNVQVDYYLDLSDFKGKVSLVNHVQDIRNYDFVTLSSDGTISLGRVEDGERKVFAEESYDTSGMLFVRTVANGTHFRAYINKELVVHGHGEAPETGSVGLKLNGKGKVLIDAVEFQGL